METWMEYTLFNQLLVWRIILISW